jgi:hypothetical protein
MSSSVSNSLPSLPPALHARVMQHLADLFAPGLDSQSFRNRTAHLMRDLVGC